MRKLTAILLTVLFLITMLPGVSLAAASARIVTALSFNPGIDKQLGMLIVTDPSPLFSYPENQAINVALDNNAVITSCQVVDANDSFDSIAATVYAGTAVVLPGTRLNDTVDFIMNINIVADLTNSTPGPINASISNASGTLSALVAVITDPVLDPVQYLLNSGKRSNDEIYQYYLDLNNIESGIATAIVYKYDSETATPYYYSVLPQAFDVAQNKINYYVFSDNYRFENTTVSATGSIENKYLQFLAMGQEKDAAMSLLALNIPYILGVVDTPGGGGGEESPSFIQPTTPTPHAQQTISFTDAAALINSIINKIIALFS